MYNNIYQYLVVGKHNENIVNISTPLSTILQALPQVICGTAAGAATISFVDDSCKLISSMMPSSVTGHRHYFHHLYVKTTTLYHNGTAYCLSHYNVTQR